MANRIYTRTGDDGTTGLFDGSRVDKHDLRVEAYGCVDELNSVLGLALAAGPLDELSPTLRRIQHELFDLGADLATPPSPMNIEQRTRRVSPEQVARLETEIDAFTAPLPPLTFFILPGGSEAACRLHIARTVCRRAERLCVALDRHQPISHGVVEYLNRLSDLLFTMARRANQLAGVADVAWSKQ